MKLPRDVSGASLIAALESLGYHVVRQKGSHIRLKHDDPPAHLITIPLHNPLKTSTLHDIVAEVARMRCVTVRSIAEML